ncbi:MAG: EamA family transporter, partial [Acidimicrobiia bacterium]
MGPRIWAAMGVASLAWGTTGVATRGALNAGVPPVGLVTIRSILAAVIIYGLLAARRRRIRIDRGRLILGGMMAVTNLALPFILFTLALQYASAGFVGLLVALVPLLTATFAHFLLPDEPLSIAKLTGLAVGVAGVVLLLGSGDSGLAEGGRPLAAAVLSVLAAASISYAAVYAKGRSVGYD